MAYLFDDELLDTKDDFTGWDNKTGTEATEETLEEALAKERKLQEAMISLKKKFGKNAVLKGMNLEEGATARDRNSRIGGHKA